jgi:hypothetical protein
VISFIIALIPAKIASDKGHSFALWWVFGVLLWIVAMPLSVFLPRARTTVREPRAPLGERAPMSRADMFGWIVVAVGAVFAAVLTIGMVYGALA